MTESKSFPQIQKLQGAWIIPCCVTEMQREDEEGALETFYKYQEIRVNGLKPQLEDVRKHVLVELNRQNDEYIFSNYKQGTQNSLQAIWVDPDTPQTVKDKVRLVRDWVNSILTYYYQKKFQIRDQSTTIDEIMQVQWDFRQFDGSKPDVSLEGLMVG